MSQANEPPTPPTPPEAETDSPSPTNPKATEATPPTPPEAAETGDEATAGGPKLPIWLDFKHWSCRQHLWQAAITTSSFMLIYFMVWEVSARKLDNWLIVARNLRIEGVPTLTQNARPPLPFTRWFRREPQEAPKNCIRAFEAQALDNLQNLNGLEEEFRQIIENSRSQEIVYLPVPEEAASATSSAAAVSELNSEVLQQSADELQIGPDGEVLLRQNANISAESSPEVPPQPETPELTETDVETRLEAEASPQDGALKIAQVRGLVTEIHLNRVALMQQIRQLEEQQSHIEAELQALQTSNITTTTPPVTPQSRAIAPSENANSGNTQPSSSDGKRKAELVSQRQSLDNDIQALRQRVGTIDASLRAVRSFMSQLGIRDASPIEIDRIAEQVDLLEERIVIAGDIAKFFFVRYRASAASASLSLLVAGICLFFIAKDGWEKADNRLINLLFCAVSLYVLFSNLPNLFLYEDNFNKNLELYLNYVNLLGETCTVFSTGVAREPESGEYQPLSVGTLVHQVDERMRRLNLLNVSLDHSRISDFRFDLNDIESPAEEEEPATSDQATLQNLVE